MSRWNLVGNVALKSSEVWPDIGAKLLSLVSVCEDGCWAFQGGRSAEGYGYFDWDGKTCRAHRVSWEVHRGPIPKGRLVLHRCDRPWCVNPEHLWLGSDQDNNHDMIAKGREAHVRGEDVGNAMLREDAVRQIKRLLAEGRHTHWEIGEMFGVTRVTITAINNGRNWAWLE